MKQTIRPELLAPAGDLEQLYAAIAYGANAVYLGGDAFGMRASAAKFGGEALRKAVEYAHEHGVRIYLTCNTVPTDQDIAGLPEFLYHARDCGVDALIISDLGVMAEARRLVPELDIHVSTQAGVVNHLTANEWHRLGAKRVVLARELSLEAITFLRENTPPELEIEAFVHGAMCVSFSGRCLLSNYMVGRDANRGECAQPCRWGYHLVEEKRPGQYYQMEEQDGGTYILNAKDLCMIEHIDKLIKAGITSFKIEGRAKSSYYVSVITNAYRMAIDAYLASPEDYQTPAWLLEEVQKVSHRQYCTGFFFGPPDNAQYYENGGYIRDYDVVALVDGYENGMLHCTQKNRFSVGDTLELLRPGKCPVSFAVEEIFDEEGTSIEVARHPMARLKIPCHSPAVVGSILRKRK